LEGEPAELAGLVDPRPEGLFGRTLGRRTWNSMMGRIGEKVSMIIVPAMEFLFYFLGFRGFLLCYLPHFLLLPRSIAENLVRALNLPNLRNLGITF
jgi:hypothetical protein